MGWKWSSFNLAMSGPATFSFYLVVDTGPQLHSESFTVTLYTTVRVVVLKLETRVSSLFKFVQQLVVALMTELSPAYKASMTEVRVWQTFSCKGPGSKYSGFSGHMVFAVASQLCLGSWLPLYHRLALLNLPNLRCLAALKFMVLPNQVLIDLMFSFSYKPEKAQ